MAITVVLRGDQNDKSALQTAVRFAAREHTPLRVVLRDSCSAEATEKHLDFCLWDVQTRVGLDPPEVTVERPDILESEISEADVCAGAARVTVHSPLPRLFQDIYGFLAHRPSYENTEASPCHGRSRSGGPTGIGR